ncbi:MAG: glycoside hydrolase family 2, partial [Gemmatimonadota bacterium]|nr:glycoside hydrolase family 2 [Gemmatimonadota bacterium]
MTEDAYPRPQLQRENWMSLNGTWQFAYDDEHRYREPDDIKSYPREILVPFPPESEASGIGDRGFHDACWYRREFEYDADGQRALLHFGAVDYFAMVWVNGDHVVTHEGGHTPFTADITASLNTNGPQVVVVRVYDDPAELTKPRGKQDWLLEPHSIWYPRTTGIWQTVWLERVSFTYLEKIRWTPHLDGFAITFEGYVAGEMNGDIEVELLLRHGDRLLARDRYLVVNREIDRRIILSDPGIDDFRNELFWSPEHPTLFDA